MTDLVFPGIDTTRAERWYFYIQSEWMTVRKEDFLELFFYKLVKKYAACKIFDQIQIRPAARQKKTALKFSQEEA